MKYAWSVAMASIFEHYNIKESDRKTDWHRLKHYKITNVCRKLTIDNSDLGVIQPKALSGMLGVQDLSIINSKIDKVKGHLFIYQGVFIHLSMTNTCRSGRTFSVRRARSSASSWRATTCWPSLLTLTTWWGDWSRKNLPDTQFAESGDNRSGYFWGTKESHSLFMSSAWNTGLFDWKSPSRKHFYSNLK